MKRRRRGLGSSFSIHVDKSVGISAVAAAEATNAENHLHSGDNGACDAAVRALMRGQFAAGRADAHAESSGKKSGVVRGILFEAKGALHKAQIDVLKSCVRR